VTNVGRQPPTATLSAKISVLLMDANSERRALRTRVMALRGAEVIGVRDLAEATSIWQRDRYDLVLLDIRMDHRGCLSWRDEIKKDMPQQIVAFLVGGPKYLDLNPPADSYVSETHGLQWGDSLRRAIRDACNLLPQRNGLVEAGWRIAAARKVAGVPAKESALEDPTAMLLNPAVSPGSA